MAILRIFLSVLICTGLLTASEKPQARTGTLSKVADGKAVTDIADVPIGVSGIVIHSYDENHRAIIASVIVTGTASDGTQLKVLPYRGLTQPKLPTVKTPPTVGDKVILGYLYDRVLPIVPNEKTYVKAKASFPSLHFVHPDLMAAELAKDKSPIPEKIHFQHMCEKFHLGIVMFMFSDGTDFLDCVSWSKVAHNPAASIDAKHFDQPFYNRFKQIPSPFYDWGEHKINDFDRFYKRLEVQQ